MVMKSHYLNGDSVTPLGDVGFINDDANAIIVSVDDGYVAIAAIAPPQSGFDAVERVGIAEDGTPIIVPTSAPADEDRELVLVREYSPGVGHKRFPSFHIDWESFANVRRLITAVRTRGSGSDEYTLCIAPAGWAHNVAQQFLNVRDVTSQVITADGVDYAGYPKSRRRIYGIVRWALREEHD